MIAAVADNVSDLGIVCISSARAKNEVRSAYSKLAFTDFNGSATYSRAGPSLSCEVN